MSEQKIKISWSAYSKWKLCEHMYNLYYLQKKGYELDAKENRVYAVRGSVIQEIFTRYYNDRLWNKDPEYLQEVLLPTVWDFILKGMYVDWEISELDKDFEYQRIKNDIVKIAECIKTEGLIDLEKSQRSEVTFLKKLENNIYLMGRIDFFLNIENSRIILDGKATTNVNNNQLFFYALLYHKIFGKHLDKLGYIYYDNQTVKYIDVDKDKIKLLEKDILKLKEAIEREDFIAEPEAEKCSKCLFTNICQEKKNA